MFGSDFLLSVGTATEIWQQQNRAGWKPAPTMAPAITFLNLSQRAETVRGLDLD